MRCARDVDVSDAAGIVRKKMNSLLADAQVSDGETDARTRNVLMDAVRFDDDVPGGSRSDYISSHVNNVLMRHRVELSDDFDYAAVVDGIKRNALNPNRELSYYAYPEDSDRWIVSDDAEVIRRLAVAGEGIAYKSFLDVSDDLREGRLVRLLPDFQGDLTPLNMICPHRKQLSAAVRLLYQEVKSHCEALSA